MTHMQTLARPGTQFAFPRLPEAGEGRIAADGLSLRSFGQREDDLALDFDREALPHLVTRILQCCTVRTGADPPGPAFFWALPIGKRIECLLTIATHGGVFDLTAHLRCVNETCGKELEVELSLAELSGEQERNAYRDHVTIDVDGETIVVRKPTGSDQLNWLTKTYADEAMALRAVVESLLGAIGQTPALTDARLRSANDALEEADPLVQFTVLAQCPHCQSETPVDVDLQDLSLRALKQEQRALLETVHRLAVVYHWGEQEILTMPQERRAHYLALLETGTP
jgi:hypothetical protein